ncbi:hypothetical protein LTR36_009635 [Oleoguttula mirabilis]|uniref:Coenzyme Q-binding protein COQ10 START domain-containing protein n=1 Tax=Oleoguttula mirabilis TaxID=1507867 RepID=A0AAV9J607_9PEZI|nr:hypothetical protein LTR36_009635 [Oleoguttula mirabilis]
MQTLRPISSALRQCSSRAPPTPLSCRAAYLASTRPQQQRAFISNPFAGAQTLTATRTLHYPAKLIYSIISDVGSYSTFLPYCQESVVTKTSQPALDGKTYPEEAKLVVGLNNDMSETFTSRIYCVPETVVEAVSGNAETLLGPDEIKHHNPRSSSAEEEPSRKDTVLSQLITRWTLRPYPYKPPPGSATHSDNAHNNRDKTSDLPSEERTEVRLNIEFQFANPVYAALSSAAAPKVAEKMIDAFVKQLESVVERPAARN